MPIRRHTIFALVMLALGACTRSMNTLPPTPVHYERLPRYPELMRVANLDGVVELRVPITAEGVPGKARIVQSTHDLLLHSVRTAVASWRYAPARHGSRAVADSVLVRFSFVLDTTSRCPPSVTRRAEAPPAPRKPDPGPTSTFDPATGQGHVMVCRYPHERIMIHE